MAYGSTLFVFFSIFALYGLTGIGHAKARDRNFHNVAKITYVHTNANYA